MTFNCHRCFAAIRVVAPRANAAVEAALRRVDWDRTDGGVVTCRRCLRAARK